MEGQSWLHLDIDQFPNDGIVLHNLRTEWDDYVNHGNPKPLINELYRRLSDQKKDNIVLSFPGNLLSALTEDRVAVLNGLVVPIVLSGEPEHCKRTFIRREKAAGRNLDERHWHQNNDALFVVIQKPHLAPHVIDVFEDNGGFRTRDCIYTEIVSRL